jgi:hypothetical protein
MIVGPPQAVVVNPSNKGGALVDKMLLRIFQWEVERQASFGLIAAQDLERALRSADTDRVWYSVQSLLVAVGNVSKLLWPGRSTVPRRGEELRTSLGIPDDSALQPRTFRNHFEHFDERLEQWATSSQRKNFADSNIGPTGMISGLEPGDYLRNFDTTKYAVTFRGDTYLLNPLIEALQELHARASVESRKPDWE